MGATDAAVVTVYECSTAGLLRMLLRYLRTARYMRPQQLSARIWRNLRRPHPDARPAPAERRQAGPWAPPVALEPLLTGAESFRALNLERACAVAADWNPVGASALWVYNLHYFDDLNARDGVARTAWHRALIDRWLSANAPGTGPGWEPYPLSKRIVNFIKWARAGNPLDERVRLSLAMQARWLLGSLEYHLLGNHLFANAKALVYAGLYFEGTEAQSWYARGMAIIARELPEQVLADGGQFERTPMYHAAAVEDLLDLINVLRAYERSVPPEWLTTVQAMRRWLKVMSHPDGGVAFFNDTAFGIAPSSAQLDGFAKRLQLAPVRTPTESLVVLEQSGYVRALTEDAYLLCDCAPVGPDYLPAHAHADSLSFELSVAGRRVFVNSGTSVYGTGSERQRQRSTAAHNTVVIDGEDSSEVWAGFRVARRARVRLLEAEASSGGLRVLASHDGYRRLTGSNTHSRMWQLGARSLHIQDRIGGSFTSAAAHFHLHPTLHAHEDEKDIALAAGSDRSLRMRFLPANATTGLEVGTWHPYFGVSVPNQQVVARFTAAELTTQISWTP